MEEQLKFNLEQELNFEFDSGLTSSEMDLVDLQNEDEPITFEESWRL